MSRITEIELLFLKLFWDKGESTAREIQEESLKYKDRKYMTVKTTLDRMHKKGLLIRRRIGPVYLYDAADSKHSFLSESIAHFSKLFLDNKLQPLLNFLAEKNDLKKTDFEKINKLFEETDED